MKRFVLFPPDQWENLYLYPFLHPGKSTQSILLKTRYRYRYIYMDILYIQLYYLRIAIGAQQSQVSFENPDYNAFPKFKQAKAIEVRMISSFFSIGISAYIYIAILFHLAISLCRIYVSLI